MVEELGADAFLYGTLSGSGRGLPPDGPADRGPHLVAAPAEPGCDVRLTADPEHFHVFSTKTGDRLS